MLVSLVQLAFLCFFGQRITSSYDGVMDASFSCRWYEQPLSFQTTLRLMRTVGLKDLVVKAGGFKLSYESFCLVSEICKYFQFNHYNSFLSDHLHLI
jgi:7tm Odorant receptor